MLTYHAKIWIVRRHREHELHVSGTVSPFVAPGDWAAAPEGGEVEHLVITYRSGARPARPLTDAELRAAEDALREAAGDEWATP